MPTQSRLKFIFSLREIGLNTKCAVGKQKRAALARRGNQGRSLFGDFDNDSIRPI